MAFLNLSSIAPTTFDNIRNLNENTRIYNQLRGTPTYHIFLSYRHVDRQYVPKVASFLKSLQAGIYVDFLDEELSNSPNSRTASILRKRITESRKLIQLLTPNANSSRWMPWELGLGDGLLSYPNAVTLPATPDAYTRISDDFLNIYGHIETDASSVGSSWRVLYPEGSSKSIIDWLRA